MNKNKAMQIFDGVMLGDGGLVMYRGGAYLGMGLSKSTVSMTDHLKWLRWIKDECLKPLGVPVSSAYPKERIGKLSSGKRKGELFRYAHLSTRLSDFLAEQYYRWYALTGEWVQYESGQYRRGDTKVLPGDLILTPVVLAHWFLGDGSSSWGFLERITPSLHVRFSTDCFTGEEVEQLIGMLNRMGITTTKPGRRKVRKGSGLEIHLSQCSVNLLADLVEPHIAEIFGDSEGPSYKDMIKRKSNPPSSPTLDTLRARLKGG